MLADIPFPFARGVKPDGLQRLQRDPVGFNLTACLRKGLIMRKTVFILSACVRMTQTPAFLLVYTVAFFPLIVLDKWSNQTRVTALRCLSLCPRLKLWSAALFSSLWRAIWCLPHMWWMCSRATSLPAVFPSPIMQWCHWADTTVD